MSVFPGGSAFGYMRPKVFVPYPSVPFQVPLPESRPFPIAESMDIASFLCNRTDDPACHNAYPSPPLPKQRFSVFRAAKETVKGIFRPITTLIKHPIKSAFIIGATVAVAAAAPITVPIMVLAGLGIGATQTIRGISTAAREAANGNYRASEKAFGDIGEGVTSVLSSLLGVRNAGSIAAEAKASVNALNPATSAFEKLDALEKGLLHAKKIQAGSWSQAFQETLSVASPQGLKTLGTQLNPIRLASLAQGKARQWVALFRESPVADLNGVIHKAQAYLKIKDADMPKVVPELKLTLPDGRIVNHKQQVHGFYAPKTHTLHIQPDRLKALQDLLGATSLDKIPLFNMGKQKPLQKAVGNLYKQSPTIEEIAVHELTHARQFKGVSRLSEAQARQIVKAGYPQQTEAAIDKLLADLTLDGTAPATTTIGSELADAEKILLSQAKLRFSNQALRDSLLENPDVLTGSRFKQRSFQNYVRAEHEIEARQTAAEALIQAATEKLGQTENLFETRQLLQQARAMLLETRLNKLMNRINSLEESGKTATAQAQKQAMKHWANVAGLQSPLPQTAKYLRKEALLEQTTEQVERFLRYTGQDTPTQPKPPGLLGIARGVIGSFFHRIANFFTPRGFRQAEQYAGLGGRKYLILNRAYSDPQQAG